MNNKYIGPLILILAHISFTISNSMVKYLSAIASTETIILFRFIMMPFILAPLFLFKIITFDKNRPWLLIFRSIAGVITMWFYFTALKLGDIGKINLLFQFCVIWAFLFSIIIFKERPKWQSITAIPVSFIGIYFILKPSHVMIIGKAEIFAMIAAFLFSFVLISIKSLRKDHNTPSILLVFYSISAVMISVPNITLFRIDSTTALLLLIIMGIFGMIAQTLATLAFKHTPASIASGLSLIGIPMMYISGVLFFQEQLTTSALIGITIVLCSMFAIVKYQ